MNRNIKEKENHCRNDYDNVKYIQPIPPKFSANWSQNIRFDKIFINISDCQYEVVPKVAKQLKWKVKKDPNSPDWDIWWTDWAVTPQTLLKMEHHQKINHFPGMFNLSRKNLLAKNLMRMRKKAPDDYQFFPPTWNLPLDYSQFRAYFENRPKGKSRTYIVKPESMSQGKGIYLTKRLQDIAPDQRCVVQRYISKPYLIDGLKFDLRLYVLVAGVDPLKVFLYHEGLGRFATQAYVVPNKDNIQDICMHLTNYAINKESEKFIFNEDDKDMSIGHKRSISAVFKLMQQKGVDIGELMKKIHQLVIKTLISGLSHLKFQYRSCQLQNYRSDMCFQILGLDVILTQQLQPLILQINYTPSFSTDTPLDETIKKNLIKQTLVLMEVNKKFKERTVNERKQYRKNRMMTGKTTKISPQERQQKKRIAQKQRQEYISKHLGGFTQIYPLDQSVQQNKVLMKKYQQLINLGDQTLEPNTKRRQKQGQKVEKVEKQKKTSKLPALNSIKEEEPKKIQKTKTSEKIIHDARERKETFGLSEPKKTNFSAKKQFSYQEESKNQLPNEMSQKLLKNVKLKDISMKKKIPNRETLLLKAIQFEGNQFDGLCDPFKQNLIRSYKNQ